MADYQEYRRRVLRKRWRRRFMATALLLLLLLVGAIGMLWKSLHREQRPSGVGQNTILQEVTQDNTWNTASYAVARQLTVQPLADSAATALDFRMAALPKSSTAVGKEWFNDVSFVGDSLTQGMQLYEEGMQNAMALLPSTYSTSLVRNHSLRGAFAAMEKEGVPADALEEIKTSLDCNLAFFGNDVSVQAMYCILAVTVFALIGIYILLNAYKKKKD